jgi:surfactin synthase thioesterase subunit
VLTHELAGQGRRRGEPRCASVAAAAAEVAERVARERPDVLFGVSLGAMVVLDAVGPRRTGGHRPGRVVLASVAPPSAFGSSLDLRLAALDDASLARLLVTDGRAPAELLASPWAGQTLEDLRANLTLASSHALAEPVTDADLDVWLGLDDELCDPAKIAAWPRASTGRVVVTTRPGSHLWPLDPSRQREVWDLLGGRLPTLPAG